MLSYLNLLRNLSSNGEHRLDITGNPMKTLFGQQWEHDLRGSFPMITTRRINWVSACRELLWKLRGSTNVNDLHPNTTYDKYADQKGDLGRGEGAQWRSWRGANDFTYTMHVDQIDILIHNLALVYPAEHALLTSWNPTEVGLVRVLPKMIVTQFWTGEEGGHKKWLDCQVYIRSLDWYYDGPNLIAQAALLQSIVAAVIGLKPRRLVLSMGVVSLAQEYDQAAVVQLGRCMHAPHTTLVLPYILGEPTIDQYSRQDPHAYGLRGYNHEGDIAVEVAK